jgi:protein-disulfide isomerase
MRLPQSRLRPPRSTPSVVVFLVPLSLLLLGAVTACNTSNGATRTKDGITAQTVVHDSVPASGTAGAAASALPDSFAQRIDQGRILGAPTAKVWMVMASDFQCPYCKQFHDQSFAELRRDYVDNGKIRIAFLNFPLRQHANAFPAAEAAMCASAQGKFWPMHDALFAAQARWELLREPGAVFDTLATSIGIDTTAFNACIAQKRPDAMILADEDRGERAGVKSTPTVIIGTRLLEGVRPTAAYRTTIDSALAAAK